MSCEKIKLVTSVNGETGDVVIKFPDTSYFYTKTETDNIVENAVKVKSVNGKTGDVVIEVPNNLSQLNNDMDYITRSETVDINTYNQHVENQNVKNTNFNNNITELQNNKADKTEIPDVSIYNPTDNFKTINGESIIGTGNIDIQGSEDKMDKHHPIFNETISLVGINPDFRLHGYITYSDYNGTFNDNCVERYWSNEEMYVRWDLQTVQNYLNDNTDTKYAAVKGFCRADSSSFGNCKYLLFIENTETGTSEQIDQYLLDTHVYGAIVESNNITGSSMAVADSRDPNDTISAIISNSIGNTSAFYIRNGVTYNCPNQMYQCDTAFNSNMSIPYMTTLIDIKGIINHYNISDYNRLTVKIVTEDTTHWHIMSSNLFFTNDTDFITGGETTKEYVLIDELNKKAEKNNLKTINGQSIIGTGNIEIQGGSGDITASADNIFTGRNTFQQEVVFENTLYNIPQTDLANGVAANFKSTVTQSSVLFTGLLKYPDSNVDISTTTGDYNIEENKIKIGTDGTAVTHLGIYENGTLLSDKYAAKTEIPTNVSQLNNDAGYLTEHQDLSNYATKTELSEYNKTNNFKTINNQSIIGTGNIDIQVSSDVTSVNGQKGDVTIEIPTNVSQLNNDAGYITDSALSDYARIENTVDKNTYNQFVENQTLKNNEITEKIGYIDTELLKILGDEV